MLEELESKLDSFNPSERRSALEELWQQVQAGMIELPPAGDFINIHSHTFFSYNTYGYSPTHIAWLARKRGLALGGIVDFDVLDGLEEFLTAGRLLGLKTCAGMETRVYVPEFAADEITSPGEPGITYHMGVGFPHPQLSGAAARFLQGLRETAQKRNLDLMGRVNKHLTQLELDYEKDVKPLTPAGNPTERHLCVAYAHKAQKVLGSDKRIAEYWSEKLSSDVPVEQVPESRELLNLIRAKTMKRGGVGYVQPDSGSFVWMDKFNEFVLQAQGIPTLTWLDGTSTGEGKIEELLAIAMQTGVNAINIIPDRNYGPKGGQEKYKKLCEIFQIAQSMDLVPIVGTEMNSPGQKFVDDFASDELKPMLKYFLKGAHIVYAHERLQRQAGLGYCSDWARKHFPGRKERNIFFEEVGTSLAPMQEEQLARFDENAKPQDILKIVG